MITQTENRGWVTRASQIVSIIFNPLLLLTYGMAIVLFSPAIFFIPHTGIKTLLFAIVATNNLVIPLLLILFLKNRNLISSYNMGQRKERLVPMLAISLLYLITSLMMMRLRVPDTIKEFLFAAASVAFVTTMVTFRSKISIHSAGAGALLASAIVISITLNTFMLPWILASILVAGVVMSARLHLNAHTPSQVYLGFLAGLLVMGGVMLI